MKKKKTKGGGIEESKLLFVIIFALIFLLILAGCIYDWLGNRGSFKVESRVSELSEYQKKDNAQKKTVAWLRVQGTNIDYPVLYAPDYDFEYETDDFAWTEADFPELNNIIYISGHNIKNLSKTPLITDESHSRFEQLMSFTYYDFAKDNQFIQYTFKGKEYVYQIYSVAYINGSDLDLYNDAPYPEENLSLVLENTKKNNIYNYDVEVDTTDKVLILNTCTRIFGEFNDTHIVVSARLLRDNEKITLATVNKNKRYERLMEEMKGGDSNDEA